MCPTMRCNAGDAAGCRDNRKGKKGPRGQTAEQSLAANGGTQGGLEEMLAMMIPGGGQESFGNEKTLKGFFLSSLIYC